MPSKEGSKLLTPYKSSGPSTIKYHHIPAPPDKGPKRPRLFSCNRVEFQRKDADYERLQAIRQLYTSRGILGGTQGDGVQFVTKIKIKKCKTPVPHLSSDNEDENCESPENANGLESAKQELEQRRATLENQAGTITKTTSDKTSVDSKNIDLLWSDSVTDDTDLSKIIRTLSQKLKQNRLLLHRSRQDRPTGSFAAPTKGEINLLFKSPEAKKAIEAKKCYGHQIFLFNHGRALSLPVSNYFAVDKRPYRIAMGVVRPSTGGVHVKKQDIGKDNRHLCSHCKGRASVK